jgi:hypothetical protein
MDVTAVQAFCPAPCACKIVRECLGGEKVFSFRFLYYVAFCVFDRARSIYGSQLLDSSKGW